MNWFLKLLERETPSLEQLSPSLKQLPLLLNGPYFLLDNKLFLSCSLRYIHLHIKKKVELILDLSSLELSKIQSFRLMITHYS